MTTLTSLERATIRAFADGETTRRDEAVAAYRRVAQGGGLNTCAAMRFMSEVLNPVPDLGLRARYRQELLATSQPG